MNTAEKRASLISQAEQCLRSTPYTREIDAKFRGLMSLADALGLQEASTDRYRSAQASAVVSEEQESAEREFRSYVRTGAALRTYVPMNEGTGSLGGYFLPTEWDAAYQGRLASFSGILRAGATVANIKSGRKWLSFYSDDTANEAEIVAENTAMVSNPSNPVASFTSPTVVRYGTSTQVTTEAVQDIAFDVDAYLQSLFAKRVSRKFNNVASVDSTNGIVPKLNVGATSASATAIAQSDLLSLVGSLDFGYREPESNPVFMMNPAVIDYLRGSTLDTAYKYELSQGKLFGYSVVPNVDMPSAISAGALSVVFGSIQRCVLVQSATPILVRSVERTAEFGTVCWFLYHHLGQKITDINAAAVLQQHA